MKKVMGQEQALSNFYEGAVLHPLIWDAIESMFALEPPGDLT